MDQVALIRDKIDIVALMSEHITLKKAGKNFKTNCPFHSESTPSFVVSPDKQLWHCFGCGKGGDIFSFLMEYEHIEFAEALRILAKRAGVELVMSQQDKTVQTKKEQAYTMNFLAGEFYHYLLTKHDAGKRARAYLEERGLNKKIWETFKIGYAPMQRSALTTFLIKKKQYNPQDIVDNGLATIRNGQTGDFFFNRLMFPLFDHRGNVVGFSGRILDTEGSGPKYINTKETLAYHKSETLFGIQVTGDAIRKAEQAILTEGEFDVMSSFQEGITNVVAIKGTALTEQQVTLLSRFTPKITICFDGDVAGQNALIRSLPILERHKRAVTVIILPDGKDPDEAIKKNPGLFKQAVKNDVNVYEYLLHEALKRFDVATSEGKKKITDMLLPLFTGIQNEIIKEHYLKKLGGAIDISVESLQKEMAKQVVSQTQEKKKPVQVERKSRDEVLEEYLFALIIQSEKPKETMEKVVAVLSDTMSKQRAYQKILDHLLTFFAEHQEFDNKRFGDTLPLELSDHYHRSFLFPLTSIHDQKHFLKEAQSVAQELKKIYIKEKMKTIAKDMREIEKQGQSTEDLQAQYSTLAQQLES